MIVNAVGFQTLIKREIVRTFSIINQVIWPPVIQTLLYVFVFGLGLGSQIKSMPAGVDVELRLELWSLLRELNTKGTTIILTTHYLEEAEELCDRIGIIQTGKLIALETTQKLIGDGSLQDIFLELTRR